MGICVIGKGDILYWTGLDWTGLDWTEILKCVYVLLYANAINTLRF